MTLGGVTSLENELHLLSLVTSSATNLRVDITLGEHDLLVVLTGSLSLPVIVSSSSGSNSRCCKDHDTEPKSISRETIHSLFD